MDSKQYYIYITTNKTNIVLYTGVTDNLIKRMYQHKQKMISSFTSKYNINKLVYYETFSDPLSAISREKQLKGGSRKKKLDLIKSINPNFEDLYEKLL